MWLIGRDGCMHPWGCSGMEGTWNASNLKQVGGDRTSWSSVFPSQSFTDSSIHSPVLRHLLYSKPCAKLRGKEHKEDGLPAASDARSGRRGRQAANNENRCDGCDDPGLCHALGEDGTQLGGRAGRLIFGGRGTEQSPKGQMGLKERPRHSRAAACRKADIRGNEPIHRTMGKS